MEVSNMTSMMALPREGHLSAVLHMFSFLKSEHNSVTVFDPSGPEIDLNQFLSEDWFETPCVPFKDDVPSNAPAPRGRGFSIRYFVDSHLANDSFAHLSRNGFILILNSAPIFFVLVIRRTARHLSLILS